MNETAGKVQVVFFHFLHKYMKEREMAPELFMDVGSEGVDCASLLSRLEVPEDMVEAVFINGTARSIRDKVYAGDRVAFVPPGTPGPYRVLLGMRAKDGNRGK